MEIPVNQLIKSFHFFKKINSFATMLYIVGQMNLNIYIKTSVCSGNSFTELRGIQKIRGIL